MLTRLLLAAVLLLSGCSDAPEPPRASPTTSAPGPSPSPSPSPSAAAPEPVRLTGDGIEAARQLLAFGDPFDQVQPALVAALGEPTKDTGVGAAVGEYGFCPGSQLRALEFGDGALFVLFGDVIGPGLTMYQWTLTDQGRPTEVPRASALVGDVTTFEFAVGDTVAELRAGAEGAALEVREGDDDPFPPSFSLSDQSAGFFGQLTGTEPNDTITGVQGGQACGE